jgi:hypothetical protein
VEKAIRILSEDTAQDLRQETIRILKDSRQSKSNLTGAERKALRSLTASGLLTVLPANEGNAAMVLGTSDYNRMIATLLEDKANEKLKKHPTDST